MGFFSWKTNDTNRSIGNIYGDLTKVITVYMKDNKGNVWEEDAYEGYGEFGGKDFFVLVAEMNGLKTRDEGILLSSNIITDDSFANSFAKNKHKTIRGLGLTPENVTVTLSELEQKRKTSVFPNLVQDINMEWKNEEPKTCQYQGFFYPEEP